MKLWLLRPIENLPEGKDPWQPWYEKAFGFVVRAETEQEARQIAQENAGDENREIVETKTPWLDPVYSTCLELLPEGEPGEIIRDYARA